MGVFAQDLIRSGWMGSINEVGLGVPLIASLLEENGASKCLFRGQTTYSPYSRHPDVVKEIPHKSPWVSEDVVIKESVLLYEQLRKVMGQNEKLFAYSVSGAYKQATERGETHLWAAVTYTSGRNRLGEVQTQTDTFHAWIPKRYSVGRHGAIADMLHAHEWFLRGTLIDRELRSPGWPLGGPVFIDAVNSSLMNVTEMLDMLAGPTVGIFERDNDRVVMRRPHDAVRNKVCYGDDIRPLKIYRGSFNPIHLGHKHLAPYSDTIFEICLQNFWGKLVPIESVAHRIEMITRCGYRVMVTHTPLFNDLTALLQGLGTTKIEYIVGGDVFNAIMGAKTFSLADVSNMNKDSGVEFLVSKARTPIAVPKQNLEHVKYRLYAQARGYEHLDEISSSRVRDTKALNLVPDEIKNYIREHKLYGISE